MTTSFGWEGIGRYGSFRQRKNVGCAGKTVKSFENACHTRHFRGVLMMRRYTNPPLPYLTLPNHHIATSQATSKWSTDRKSEVFSRATWAHKAGLISIPQPSARHQRTMRDHRYRACII